MAEKLLRRPEVEAITGLSRASIYARMAKGDFPRPMRLGTARRRMARSDVQEWIDSLNPADSARPRRAQARRRIPRGGGVNRVRESAPGPAGTGPGAGEDTARKRRA